ncbi:hypothetical protein HDV00_009779 [Rhizophlyctis rosea]|nr:hypothetical protein HDV00_009779 [Rhizophlyctis rosea]
MSDTENQTIEQPPSVDEPEPPKKKRQVSPEQKAKMLENLAKARETRAANRRNVTKYPKAKRERAQELYQEDIDKKAAEKARLLAEELIKKRQQEEELEEYRRWKQEQQEKTKEREAPEEKPVAKKKPAPKKKETSSKSSSAKIAGNPSKKSSRKTSTKQEVDQQPEEQDLYSLYSNNVSYGGFNIDDFLD